MTFQELALRIFYAAQPLLPFLGAVGVSTCALLAALLLLSRGLGLTVRLSGGWDCFTGSGNMTVSG